jgi:hypothetical protein
MRKVVLAAAAAASIAAWLPVSGLAQTAPPPSRHSPINAHNITDQLGQLSARIDRYLTRGQLSHVEAVEAHRQVNAMLDEASADREQNGGQLTEAERFNMQAKIDDLDAVIRRERAAHRGAPAN